MGYGVGAVILSAVPGDPAARAARDVAWLLLRSAGLRRLVELAATQGEDLPLLQDRSDHGAECSPTDDGEIGGPDESEDPAIGPICRSDLPGK
jgi:hypothetical protein